MNIYLYVYLCVCFSYVCMYVHFVRLKGQYKEILGGYTILHTYVSLSVCICIVEVNASVHMYIYLRIG